MQQLIFPYQVPTGILEGMIRLSVLVIERLPPFQRELRVFFLMLCHGTSMRKEMEYQFMFHSKENRPDCAGTILDYLPGLWSCSCQPKGQWIIKCDLECGKTLHKTDKCMYST